MSFTAFDGYALYADLQVGSNSNDAGTPGLLVGDTPRDASANPFQWDIDPTDGFDSGWVQVDLTVWSSGDCAGAVLSVNDGQRQISYEGGPCGEILWFAVRAGLSGRDDTVSFRDLAFKFYAGATDTNVVETDTMDDFSATTVGGSTADTEAIIEVGPEGCGYHKAVFSAQIRLQSAQQCPDPSELFGQVFVFTAGE